MYPDEQVTIVIGLLEKHKERGITQTDASKALKKAHLIVPKLNVVVGDIRNNLGVDVIRFKFPGGRTDRWGLRKYVEGAVPRQWWKGAGQSVREPVSTPSENEVRAWIFARRTLTETARACKTITPMMLWPEAMKHERATILKLMDEVVVWADTVMAYGERREEEDFLRAKIDKILAKKQVGVGNSDNERAEAEKKVAIFEQRLLEVQARSLNGHH